MAKAEVIRGAEVQVIAPAPLAANLMKGSKRRKDQGPTTRPAEVLSNSEDCQLTDNDEGPKRLRRTVAVVNYKEKSSYREGKEALISVKEERVADSEEIAILQTVAEPESEVQRRVLDFSIYDEDGNEKQLEEVDQCSLYMSACILSMAGQADKNKGVLCQVFGPILSWEIDGYEKGNAPANIWVNTGMASYRCVRPAGTYKKVFAPLQEKADLCVEVFRALSKPEGGNPGLAFEELVARVTRALSRTKKPATPVRDALLANGDFIVCKLHELDATAEAHNQLFSGLPALSQLQEESRKHRSFLSRLQKGPSRTGSLTIRDTQPAIADNESSITTCEPPIDDEAFAKFLASREETEVAAKRGQRRGGKPKVYIKINEAEIADDYPLPAFYKGEEDEMDEYLLFDEEVEGLAPEDLPRRRLEDWTLYDGESRLVSLELVPMLPGVETDTEVFGSGVMMEDDGSGFSIDEMDKSMEGASGVTSTAEGSGPDGGGEELAGASGSSKGEEASAAAGLANPKAGDRASGTSSMEQEGAIRPDGIRLYLSAIKEWVIEFGGGMLFISIRTDGAWYRLGKPSRGYSPWYLPVLKTAQLAVKAITLMKAETRVSRLSFNDIINRLAAQEAQGKSKAAVKDALVAMERYIIVHGQIILQQFREFPDVNIQRSPFVTALGDRMMTRQHTKLLTKKVKLLSKKGSNLNPRASLRPDATKRKPMRATTTTLVQRIWKEYYDREESETRKASGADVEAEAKDAGADEEGGEELREEESEDEAELEELAPAGKRTTRGVVTPVKKQGRPAKAVLSESAGLLEDGSLLYQSIKANGLDIAVGSAVTANPMEQSGEEPLPSIFLVKYIQQTSDGDISVHGQLFERGSDTVLGNAADERELFLTTSCCNLAPDSISGVASVKRRDTPFGYQHCKASAAAGQAEGGHAKAPNGASPEADYFYQFLYAPEKGAFVDLHTWEANKAAASTCQACAESRAKEEAAKTSLFPDKQGFRYAGTDYRVNDYLYLDPQYLSRSNGAEHKGSADKHLKGGRNIGLRAWAIGQLLEVTAAKGLPSKLKVKRFYRPEDIDDDLAYKADVREVFYSDTCEQVEVNAVMGKCLVRKRLHDNDVAEAPHVFLCGRMCNPKEKTVHMLPAQVKLATSACSQTVKAAARGKGKAAAAPVAEEGDGSCGDGTGGPEGSKLVTLDIFAGCGGLSEGLHQSGVTDTKWAIEYEHPAAEAFKLNHSGAEVFCENCNVILRSIMEKGGDLDDCVSTPEADEGAAKLSDEQRRTLPMPGQVDFIHGGPPCQGFSGMNRFNKRAWSKVQCEMILAFLSYADYLRPRYFLLENVRNFVSFNKGQTFRLSVASLLAMGYQVRFGVLQAGNYGVSQSRKRAFIWAAAPGEVLPEWPEPMHVFASSQINISLPGGQQYSAVRDTGKGAPLRPITVRDTVADLPPVENGAAQEELSYGGPPQSWFQKHVRGSCDVLRDHVAKEMNELNLIRCQRIPRAPGSDWRCLPDEKVTLSNKKVVDLIPWCLPNTADRHNQWKGLFGRLDWKGNFPTSVTDPQPMGKVGMCFHPQQDRIVTVRECARSQGFPDSFKFCGTVQAKHRQIGNAVPPPLARALGMSLRAALDAKKGESSVTTAK